MASCSVVVDANTVDVVAGFSAVVATCSGVVDTSGSRAGCVVVGETVESGSGGTVVEGSGGWLVVVAGSTVVEGSGSVVGAGSVGIVVG